jgi:hypothetical protein
MSAMAGALPCVFHIHTRHSFDCVSAPARTIAWAKRHGIRVLGITDHETVRGAQEAAACARGSDVQVIVGAEYATDRGDVIGLFLRDEIATREAFAVIDAIRDQGGVSLLPHPYQSHTAVEELAQAVDVIEVFNARCSERANRQAAALAARHGKPALGGADAHFVRDLAGCICYLDAPGGVTAETLLHADRRWVGRPSPVTRLYWSQVIKGLKTGDRRLARAQVRKALLTYVRNAVGAGIYGTAAAVWHGRRGS